jgi:hypothetical protein
MEHRTAVGCESNSVRIEPGFPAFRRAEFRERVLTSDVWGFLRHQVSTAGLSEEAKGKALAFWRQAREFFAAAQESLSASRPLLYYYAFLNVVKAYLLCCDKEEILRFARHGLKEAKGNIGDRFRFEDQELETVQREGEVNVFPLFVEALEGETPGEGRLKVLELLEEVPGVHRTFVQVARRGRIFMPVKEWRLENCGGGVRARLFTEKNDQDVRDTMHQVREAWCDLLDEQRSDDGRGIKDGEERVEWVTKPEPGQGEEAVGRLAAKIREKGVWVVLTDRGYRTYIAARRRFPQLATVFAVMFYLGSVTRYRPYLWGELEQGDYGWLVTDFLETQPMQFLYGLASTWAGREVARAWALL